MQYMNNAPRFIANCVKSFILYFEFFVVFCRDNFWVI